MNKLFLSFFVLSVAALSGFADIELVSPKKGEVVPVLTDAQRAFVNLSPAEKRAKFADKDYRRKEMGLPAEVVDGVTRKPSWPKTTRLEWKPKSGASVYAVKVVGRNGDLAFDQCVTGTTAVIDNLMVATDYDWMVTALPQGEGALRPLDSGTSSFRTEDVPLRLCRFPSTSIAARDRTARFLSREVLRRPPARAQEALSRPDDARIGRGLRSRRRHHRCRDRELPSSHAGVTAHDRLSDIKPLFPCNVPANTPEVSVGT